jgi:S-adenosylmethionine:tRNA ribosyltransferase-isomerase
MVGGRRLTEGMEITVQRGDVTVDAVVEEVRQASQRVIRFDESLNGKLDSLGEAPLPPYITERLDDAERYQTVFAQVSGSAAAPTAGLHLTGDLLLELQERGVKIAYCTLHIGLDTFAPVKVEDVSQHHIHRERAVLSAEDARLINEAKLAGGRIIAVGTTSTRTLESAAIRSMAFGSAENDPSSIAQTLKNMGDGACPWRSVIAIDEETDLFITPGYEFRAVDVLLTNFHLPKSTLLMLVSAFANRALILRAYQHAIEDEYRFYSLGDAMLLI